MSDLASQGEKNGRLRASVDGRAAKPPRDALRVPRGRNTQSLFLIGAVVVVLYLGRDLLIPLALSILLAFLLAPAVTRLERWRMGRIGATSIVVVVAFSAIAVLVWVAATQVVALAEDLPQYRENIRAKIESVSGPPTGSFGRAAKAVRDLGADLGLSEPSEPSQASQPGQASGPPAATPPPSPAAARGSRTAGPAAASPGATVLPQADTVSRPVPVVVQESSRRPLAMVEDFVSPLLAPLGTAGAVIVFTVLILLQREDMRDRLIRLIGQKRIHVTTEALEEAAQRVSRYLRMQLLVNVTYGLPVGIALHLLGIPNAALWGLLATVLRFVPYVGPWIAAAFPIALAFAIGEGWSLVLWTVAIFLVLELISNNVVEPWLYGASTGLSAFAILIAALFWTWMWGAVGLLLATPLTVCVVVMGRYIPQLAFLEVLLGDAPVLEPHTRLYQRLLARDEDEALEIVDAFLREHTRVELYDAVLMPALDLAEQDRHREDLEEERARAVYDGMRRLVEIVAERPVDAAGGDTPDTSAPAPAPWTMEPQDGRPARLAVLPARDEADELAGLMLSEAIAQHAGEATVLPHGMLVGEMVDRLEESGIELVCVSAVPPLAVMHAGYLCKRLRARLPHVRVVVAIWNAQGDLDDARSRLEQAGIDRLVTSVAQAEAQLRELALQASMSPAAVARGAG